MPTGYPVATAGPRQAVAAAAASPGRLTIGAPVIVDRQTRPLTATEEAGEATITLGAPPQGYAFEVEIIDIWSDSTQATTASVYLGSAAPQNEVDYSSNAGHDIAYETPAIYVPSGQQLLIVWSGLSAGANCTARIQYSLTRFVPVSYGG